MKQLTARDMAQIAIVAAIYIVLTITPPLNAMAYYGYQFRVSEMMNFLAFYNKKYLICLLYTSYQFTVEPSMLEKSGVLANGVMIEVLMKVIRKMMQHSGRSLIVEQLIINFLQAVQVDDVIRIEPQLVRRTRRSALVDFSLYLDLQDVYKRQHYRYARSLLDRSKYFILGFRSPGIYWRYII